MTPRIPQPPPSIPAKKPSVVCLVKPEQSLTRRVFMVLDVSGSMESDGKIQRVLGITREILAKASDDGEFAIVTFADSFRRWPGRIDPDDSTPLRAGWARLPSADNVKAAQAWLSGFPGEGNTFPDAALTLALLEPVTEESIVFASDGGFSSSLSGTLQALKNGQDWREAQHYGAAPVLVYGIGDMLDKDRDNLTSLAKAGKGGFYMDLPKASSETKTPW